MAQTIALEGIISCSVFHFHEDTLIFRFHELRHTFAVLSLQNGDDVKTVQGNLGHATAAFTLDVYGHVSEKMKEDSAARMEGYIQGYCKSVKGKHKGKRAKKGSKKALNLLRFKAFPLAADEGFEPSQTESESGVLPLH